MNKQVFAKFSPLRPVIRVVLLVMIALSSISCEKEPEEMSCRKRNQHLQGTYSVVVVQYPRDSKQEGEEKFILAFNQPESCYTDGQEVDKILFNNLFGYFECTSHELLNNNSFYFGYDKDVRWSGAPLKGEGNIIDGKLHFRGTVYTSAGEFPIVLEGEKVDDDMRTTAC